MSSLDYIYSELLCDNEQDFLDTQWTSPLTGKGRPPPTGRIAAVSSFSGLVAAADAMLTDYE